MPNEIIVALIGLGGSAIGSLFGVLVSGKLTEYRLSQLESKVEKHNSLIERTYCLEKKASIYEERLKVANHRISDIEEELRREA